MAIRKLGSQAILAITSAETVANVIRRMLVEGISCDDKSGTREIYTEAVSNGREYENSDNDTIFTNNAIHGALLYTNSILKEYRKIVESDASIIVDTIRIIIEQLKRLLTSMIN